MNCRDGIFAPSDFSVTSRCYLSDAMNVADWLRRCASAVSASQYEWTHLHVVGTIVKCQPGTSASLEMKAGAIVKKNGKKIKTRQQIKKPVCQSSISDPGAFPIQAGAGIRSLCSNERSK